MLLNFQMVKKRDEDLAEFVRRVMKEKNLTVRDVEARSGNKITNSYVTKILNRSQINLSVEKVDALARGLGVLPEKLFMVARGATPLESDEEFIDSMVHELFLALKEANAEDKKTIYGMIDIATEHLRRKRVS